MFNLYNIGLVYRAANQNLESEYRIEAAMPSTPEGSNEMSNSNEGNNIDRESLTTAGV